MKYAYTIQGETSPAAAFAAHASMAPGGSDDADHAHRAPSLSAVWVNLHSAALANRHGGSGGLQQSAWLR